ncbi:hypothetical protein [Anaeromyxobacter paludicola]|uniref:Uncharacterized protein n=1 Tax=Anaeromyxobacter paludicola TaxID=2918171 RepID=A0ABM7X5U0_9BACT|nr:hypothetical protein [Anaeromyxobacter paludicola]BDG07176.1 hypothetical protein AMPC_02890 [Anaeromyxobacter paludicola]
MSFSTWERTARGAPRFPALPAGRSGGARGGALTLLTTVSAALVACLPALGAALYVARSTVDVPYYDQWRFVPLLQKLADGTLGWSDLTAQHDGHRVILARLVTLASARFAGWNNLVEVWAGFACLAATAGLLLRCHWRTAPPDRPPAWRLLSALPFLSALFSLRQWENLLAPWAATAYAGVLLVLAALWLESRERPRTAAAMATAVVASLTFTNCLLVWPLAMALPFLERWWPRDRAAAPRIWRSLAVWTAGLAIFCAAYFRGYQLASQQLSGRTSYLMRFLVALGTPLSYTPGVIAGGALPFDPAAAVPTAALLGLAVLLSIGLSILAMRRTGSGDVPLLVAFAGFGVGSVLLLALGRSNLGVGQALSSRYTTWATVAVVAALFLLRAAAASRRWLRPLHAAAAIGVLATNLVAFRVEFPIGAYRGAGLARWAEVVRHYRTATDAELANPHYSPEAIREWSRILERLRLSAFRHAGPETADR